ncbi:MAG: grasp-with-spasm system SPASM domain peptide maturase [Bacteroidia bacterium]
MKYFILYANCIPVKGAKRSLICDLQRNQYWYIPEGLYDVLTSHGRVSLDSIKTSYENKFDLIIDEYFEFLASNELGFWTTEEDVKNFPELNLDWDEPSLITNAIIDSDVGSSHNYTKIFDELEELGCKHIQLRFFDEIIFEQLTSILEKLHCRRLISVEIILPFKNKETEILVADLSAKYQRITQIAFYNSQTNNSYVKYHSQIINITLNINSELHCGIISSKYFTLNIKNFTESVNYNSCLNRKISIDKKGQIKNCPSLSKEYGHINNITLIDVVLKEDIKKLWKINKDKIEICKDCEFRHICTDCRAYVEQPENIYSKPLKCGYNPYTCQWEEWSNNPLKQKAISHYEMRII